MQMSDDLVRCLFFASRGTLWVGTDGGGLNRFVPEKGSFLRYQPSPSVPGSLSHAKVRVIFEDRSGRIWIGTFGGGLNRYEKDTDSFTVFRHDAANPNGLCNDFVMSLNEDSAGNLWIGTEAGLNRFEYMMKLFGYCAGIILLLALSGCKVNSSRTFPFSGSSVNAD